MTICLKQILFHQEQLKSNLKELFSHFGKYVKQYTNIFAEVGGLLKTSGMLNFLKSTEVEISQDTDLDTIRSFGIYSTGSLMSMVNRPSDSNGNRAIIIVFGYMNGARVMQVLIDEKASVSTRFYVGSWTAWVTNKA